MQSPLKNASSAACLTFILAHFAHAHPEITADIRKFCLYLDRKYQQRLAAPDDVRIIHAINEGFVTARDISGYTLIPYETVTKLLHELHALGAITSTRKPVDTGRGGDKKTRLYWATDQASAVLRQRADAVCPKHRAQQLKLATRLAQRLAALDWPSEDAGTKQGDEMPAAAKGTPWEVNGEGDVQSARAG